MRAKLLVVFGAQLLGSLRDRTPRPPAADSTGDPAEQRADGAGGGANARSQQHAGDAARCLADLIAETGFATVHAKRRLLRALDPPVRRAPFGQRFVAIA